jgi:hypothetical protein
MASNPAAFMELSMPLREQVRTRAKSLRVGQLHPLPMHSL